jgi:hypothetical protein
VEGTLKRALLLFVSVLVIIAGGFAQEFPVTASPTESPSLHRIFSPDVQNAQPSYAAMQPWQVLDRLPEADRLNAEISIALDPDASLQAKALTAEVENAWNRGDFKNAIVKLTGLGSLVDPASVEIGLQWKEPKTASPSNLLAFNTRVGTIDSARCVALATDSAGTRLFAVISQSGDGFIGSWHVFLSTDAGSSWVSTATISNVGTAAQLSLAPVHDYLYVGYIPGGSKSLRVRRLTMSDGKYAPMADGNNYTSALVLSGTDSLTSIAGASNAAMYNNRMYFAVTTGTKKVRFFWSFPTGDSLFTEVPDSSGIGAVGGLSIAYSYSTTAGHYVVISYCDSLGHVCIDTVNSSGTKAKRCMSWPGVDKQTSVSAYGDTVLCAFDYRGSTLQMHYLISYNAGSSWSTGMPEDTSQTHESPVAMLEKGQGMGIFYRYYTATGREGRFIYRKYKGPGAWSTPEAITDYTPHYWRSAIAALGDKTFGVLYITFNFVPALNAVIFVRHQVTTTGVADQQPNAPATFQLYQNYPNPFNPSTEIAYELGTATRVTLAVYDILGREVATLVDGHQEVGQKTVTWNASGLASGVYVCRLQAGSFSAVRKLVLMK